MNLSFYHYVHCPFCVRVRMAAGLLGKSYQSNVLPYDDEETPLKLTGKKMLPIMVFDGIPMNESLDIMKKMDEKNILKIDEVSSTSEFTSFEALLNKLGSNVHNLAMPYWIYTPEFNEASRAYFQKKKEQKRGPFKDLVKKQKTFIDDISKDLEELSNNLRPYYKSDTFSVYDLMLASHIWGLYVVPEFQFTDKMHRYLQSVKDLCHFNYHEDFWR